MRIAIVHSRYRSDGPSGENNVVDDQFAVLGKAGHDVRLIDRSSDYLSGSTLRTLGAAVTVGSGLGPSPASELDKFQPNIVHVHNLFPNWGARWVKRWSPRVVATLHNFRPICAAATLHRDGAACRQCPESSSLWAIRHRCYKNSAIQSLPLAIATRDSGRHNYLLQHARRLIVLNDYAREALHSCTDPGKLRLVENFAPDGLTVGFPAQREAWVYAGRLDRTKGIIWLARNWPANHRLDIYGSGPAVAEIRDITATRHSVRFLGELRRGEVIGRIAESKGLILPSLWAEGLPTVVLEALSTGVPVLMSTRCASQARLTSEGGVVPLDVSERDSAIVQRDLHRALDETASRHSEIGEHARRTYLRNFSAEAWLQKIESVYDEVLSGSGS